MRRACATFLPVGKCAPTDRETLRAADAPRVASGRRTLKSDPGAYDDVADFDDDAEDDTGRVYGGEGDDDDDEIWRDLLASETMMSGAPMDLASQDSEQQRILRTRTLAKYKEILQKPQGPQQQEQLAQQFRERSENPLPDQVESEKGRREGRARRAQTLKSLFFSDDEEAAARRTSGARPNGRKAPPGAAERALFAEEDDDDAEDDDGFGGARASATAADDAFNYPLMEKTLEESLRGLLDRQVSKSLQSADGRGGDSAAAHEADAVAVRVRRLLEEQDEMLRAARAQSKKVVPALKTHIAFVQKELARKLRENFDGSAEPAPEDFTSEQREQLRRADTDRARRKLEKRFRKDNARAARDQTRGGGGASDHARSALPTPTLRERAAHAAYEEQVSRIRKELAVLTRHLSQVRMEQHFPRGMLWKLKVDAGDGTFIGVRDLEIGRVSADFRIETNAREPNRVRIVVTNVVAAVGLLELSIRGANTRARLLGGLLTPTINRLDLDVTGEWALELKFLSGDGRKQPARWQEVPSRSKFALNISRKVTGLTTMRLPKSIMQTLTNMLIPKLISGAVRSLLPPQAGLLLSEEYNRVQVQGAVRVVGDMSPRVWREPLVGPTAAAGKARAALGISQEEAVLIDFICRGPRAAAAGFKPKSVSLARLWKWRLRFATYRLSELERVLDDVQKDARTVLPPGWLAQLVTLVAQLAKKPVDFKVNVTKLEADVDLPRAVDAGLDLYVAACKASVNMARAERARSAALLRLREAQQHADAVHTLLAKFIVPLLHPRARVEVNGLLVGGLAAGLGACSLRDLRGDLKLPAHVLFRPVLPANAEQPLEIEAQTGPRPGEYTVTIRNHRVSGEGAVSLRNAKLELFPAGAQPGAVGVDASEIRGSMDVRMMDELLASLNDQINAAAARVAARERRASDDDDEDDGTAAAAPPPRGEFVYAESKRLVQEAEVVFGLSRTFEAHEEDLPADNPEAAREVDKSFLPRFMVDDAFDLRADLRGVQVEVRKEHDARRDAETLRVALSAQGPRSAYFRLRVNMRDVFELL